MYLFIFPFISLYKPSLILIVYNGVGKLLQLDTKVCCHVNYSMFQFWLASTPQNHSCPPPCVVASRISNASEIPGNAEGFPASLPGSFWSPFLLHHRYASHSIPSTGLLPRRRPPYAETKELWLLYSNGSIPAPAFLVSNLSLSSS